MKKLRKRAWLRSQGLKLKKTKNGHCLMYYPYYDKSVKIGVYVNLNDETRLNKTTNDCLKLNRGKSYKETVRRFQEKYGVKVD